MASGFSVCDLADVFQHLFVFICDLPFIQSYQTVDECRACPSAVHSCFLMHSAGVFFVVKWPAVNLQHTCTDTGLRCLCAHWLFSGGQCDGSPLVGCLQAAALASSDLSSS